MSLHNVFELIRKEEAVLWVGAGFSAYAGYPLAGKLSEIIYNSLSTEERKSVSKDLSLSELCEAYVNKRGRNQLIQLLRTIFHKKPASLEHHKRLAHIPLVKTIITTNYDNLFENAFEGELQKIVNNIDASYIDDKKLELFKVHGDLSDPNSIVITSSDYNDFLRRKTQNNIYWSCVKGRLANKAVVMLGYSLSDPNIELILNQIYREFEGNRKEIYFIAPGVGSGKRAQLDKLEIKYIDMKGEVFVRKLQQNVYEKIITDFSNGKLRPETLSKILSKKNLKAVYETTPVGKIKIKSIGQIKGKTKVNIAFKANAKNKSLEDLDAFIKGKTFGRIEVDSNNFTDFKFTISGINLLPNLEEGIKFSITSLPTEEGTLDVYFEDGFELNDVKYKIFKSEYKFEAICTYKSSELKMIYSFEDNPMRAINFKYEQIKDFENIKEAIECYSFLQRLAKSLPLTIYSKNRNQSVSWTPPLNQIPVSEVEANLEYYGSLRQIEIIYKEKFRNITFPKQEYYDKMQYLITHSTPVVGYLNEEISFEIVGDKIETLEKLKAVYDKGENLEVEFQNKEVYEVHGKNIILGYRTIEFHSPYSLNIEKLISGEDETVKIKAQEKVKIRYRK